MVSLYLGCARNSEHACHSLRLGHGCCVTANYFIDHARTCGQNLNALDHAHHYGWAWMLRTHNPSDRAHHDGWVMEAVNALDHARHYGWAMDAVNWQRITEHIRHAVWLSHKCCEGTHNPSRHERHYRVAGVGPWIHQQNPQALNFKACRNNFSCRADALNADV